MIDLLFCTHNRRMMTTVALTYLIRNTDWRLVRKFHIYDDMSIDGAPERAKSILEPLFHHLRGPELELVQMKFGGPVNMMRHFLENNPDVDLFAKLDNDTVVPPLWLNICQGTMDQHRGLDLLGIECLAPSAEAANPLDVMTFPRGFEASSHIGGIGLMRGSAFRRIGTHKLAQSGTFFGFTEFQHQHPTLTRGWLKPALPVVLLDHLPQPYWRDLSALYVKMGWARAWPAYSPEQKFLWDWMDDGPLSGGGKDK